MRFDAAILGIDTANLSGYAVRIRGTLVCSGTVPTLRLSAVSAVLQTWLARAGESFPIVILERAYGGSQRTLEGLAAARERWLVALRELEVAEQHIVLVRPNQWRRELLGAPWARVSREQIRAHEMAQARAEVRCELAPDEAAAILISRWGASAATVRERLPRSKQRTSHDTGGGA